MGTARFNFVKHDWRHKGPKEGTQPTPGNKVALMALWEKGSVKEAAAMIGVSTKTIEHHLCDLRARLGLHGQTYFALCKWGVRTGLLSCLVLATCAALPPGEQALATSQSSSKPQGIVQLPVSPAGSGFTTGSGTYPFKTVITITAYPFNTNWIFTRWSDSNTNNPRSLSVPKGTTVLTALFNQAPATNYSVTLQWNPSTGSDVVGYSLYYGPASGTYTNHYHAGNVTSARIAGLSATQFFCAKAMDSKGFESICSNEVKYP